MDVDTLVDRLLVELHAINCVPAPLASWRGVRGEAYSRGHVAVEVHHELARALHNGIGKAEEGTARLQRAGLGRVLQLAVACHVVDVGVGGVDVEGVVVADELHLATGHLDSAVRLSGADDGDALEHRILNVVAKLPLDDIGNTSLQHLHGLRLAVGVAEGQAHMLRVHRGTRQRLGGGTVEDRALKHNVKRQAQRVPLTVLEQRAAAQRHVIELASSGSLVDGRLVGIVVVAQLQRAGSDDVEEHLVLLVNHIIVCRLGSRSNRRVVIGLAAVGIESLVGFCAVYTAG